MYQFTPAAILGYATLLPPAIARTLILTFLVLALAAPIGLVLAQARRGRNRSAAAIARAWVELFRNIPLLVLLYTCYFGLAQIGLRLGNEAAALLALTLNASAYLGEIIRAGYAAIPPGQAEAARALGLGRLATERHVLLPQAFAASLPALCNQAIGVLLGSSVAAIIGVHELADWMLATGSSSFRYMEAFLLAALVYIALCQCLGAGGALLERRLARS